MGNVISIIMTIIRDHENSDRNAFPVDKAHLVFLHCYYFLYECTELVCVTRFRLRLQELGGCV